MLLDNLLQISLAVVITKTDLVPAERLETAVEDVIEHLNGICQKEAYRISNDIGIITFLENQRQDTDVPILCISSVTGAGLLLVTKMLHLLPPALSSNDRDRLEKVSPEFIIGSVK